MHSAYFECLRFILQQINNDAERTASVEQFAFGLLEQQLLQPIGQLLLSENIHAKYFFQHTSALVAFWDRQCNDESNKSSCSLYVKLLNVFWTRIFEMVTQHLTAEDVNEQWLSHVLLLVQDLHVANPSLETHCVKFLEADEEVENSEKTSQHSTPSKKARAMPPSFKRSSSSWWSSWCAFAWIRQTKQQLRALHSPGSHADQHVHRCRILQELNRSGRTECHDG